MPVDDDLLSNLIPVCQNPEQLVDYLNYGCSFDTYRYIKSRGIPLLPRPACSQIRRSFLSQNSCRVQILIICGYEIPRGCYGRGPEAVVLGNSVPAGLRHCDFSESRQNFRLHSSKAPAATDQSAPRATLFQLSAITGIDLP